MKKKIRTREGKRQGERNRAHGPRVPLESKIVQRTEVAIKSRKMHSRATPLMAEIIRCVLFLHHFYKTAKNSIGS